MFEDTYFLLVTNNNFFTTVIFHDKFNFPRNCVGLISNSKPSRLPLIESDRKIFSCAECVIELCWEFGHLERWQPRVSLNLQTIALESDQPRCRLQLFISKPDQPLRENASCSCTHARSRHKSVCTLYVHVHREPMYIKRGLLTVAIGAARESENFSTQRRC